ncbi:double-strand break repair helicase AddA [Afifella sp. YEN Y35]|uniref:double-strand break repair helicase AddA n=1 Tax=Afifella sp. YEN Y35 TaxID=3388337 RepID=UPI0039E04AD3
MKRPASPTERQQWQASDPAASAWVAANAGSGKTHVLTQRVVRLLLAGADPAAIVCLTYTKAAAAEMSGRVFKMLGEWATLPDAELTEAIARSQGETPRPETLTRARRLFAQALETPGGLNIQTIHAFCERILHQFPFEANVPGHFEVLDETAAEGLLLEARQAVLRAAKSDGSRLGTAFTRLATLRSDQDIEAALAALVAERDRLERWIAWTARKTHTSSEDIDDAIADLRRRMGLEADESEEALCAEICRASEWASGDCRSLCDALSAEAANRTDEGARGALEAILAHEGGPLEADFRAAFFLTAKPEGWSTRSESRRFSAAFRRNRDDLDELFSAEAARLQPLRERLSLARTAEATEALLLIGGAILQRYRILKQRRGFLDFSDLILRTRNLLQKPDVAAWVQYKLDAGISHLLVDEAQDTSPDAWAIVERLAEEFFAGESAERRPRTLFAVGDDKQSIYGFQGAEPRLLAELGRKFKTRAEAAAQEFRAVSLGVSFRSTQAVLDAVDTVFDGPLSERVTRLGYQRHQAYRQNVPGRVEIWPRIIRPKGEMPEDWWQPFDAPAESERKLAEEIADEVARLLHPEKRLPSGKAISAGEIMILTRKRGSFARAMVRALKARNLPTAGADRIALADHIIVQDLLALADVVLLPEDDLQLAALLKSPLFGFDDDDLMALAIGRGRESLFSRLRASEDPRYSQAAERLRHWMAMADQMPPFAFYTRLVEAEGARKAFRARMGSEADDVLDLFLSATLSLERVSPPGLQALAAALREGGGDIKRELSETTDAVRVMTVHGAKGLEADIVFLADTGGQIAAPQHRDALAFIGDDDDPAFIWRQSKEDATPQQREVEAKEAEAARDEYFRLLYVAMTRARDVLYVTGIRGDRTPKDGWYAAIRNALAAEKDGDAEDASDDELAERLHFFGLEPGDGPPPAPEERVETPSVTPRVLPEWAERPAAPAPRPPQPLRPSSALAEEDPPDSAPAPVIAGRSAAMRAAAGRGRAIHRLLQFMPDWPADERQRRGELLLARDWPEAAPADVAAALSEAAGVLAHPDLAGFFAEGSRGEVSLVGEIATSRGTFAVGGRVDRLAVTESAVLLADYKTSLSPPASLAAVDEGMVRQLALYARLLGPLYPGRKVQAALVFTAGPRIFPVSAERLAEALAPLDIAHGGPSSGTPLA